MRHQASITPFVCLPFVLLVMVEGGARLQAGVGTHRTYPLQLINYNWDDIPF